MSSGKAGRMAVVNSSTFNFAEVVQKYVEDYNGECIEVMTEVIPQVAKEAAKKLRNESPKVSGKYAKGWKVTVEKGRMRIGAKVHGKKGTYNLAHLLEHGHAKRNGGRTRPEVHIKPVEEWAIDEATDRIIERMSEAH